MSELVSIRMFLKSNTLKILEVQFPSLLGLLEIFNLYVSAYLLISLANQNREPLT